MFSYNNGLSREVINQVIVEEPTNRALLVIDSKDATSKVGGDKFQSTFLNENFNKIALSRYHVDYRQPQLIVNINDKFTIKEFDNNGNELREIVVDLIDTQNNFDGFEYFTTIDQMRLHLQTKLGITGLTFAVDEVGDYWRISIAGNKKFSIVSAKNLTHFGLGPFPNPVEAIIVKPRLLYTGFIDIFIDELKEGQKNKDFFSTKRRPSNGFFHRIFLENLGVNQGIIQNLNYNLIRPRNLDSITIRLYDEYHEVVFLEKFQLFSEVDYYLEFILG